MTGRQIPGGGRLAISTAEVYPHERYFPLRTTINPGISRNVTGSHHVTPGLNGYRDAMTIRTVSADLEEQEDDNDTDDSLAPQHSPTTPPRTPSRSANRLTAFDFPGNPMRGSPEPEEPASPRSKGRQVIASLSDLNLRQNDNSPIEKGYSIYAALPARDDRYTLEQTGLSQTPPSATHRQRHASAHASSTGFPSSMSTGFPSSMSTGFPSSMSTGYPSSISTGFPSTSPSPAPGKIPGKSKQKFLRPQNSINTLHKHASSEPPISPVQQQSTDVSRVLQLMKELRGRMEGFLEFRVADNMHWVKGYCLINEDTGSLVYQKEESISSSPINLIPDLRGCQVKAPTQSEESDGVIELITHSSKLELKLRPYSPQQYDQWLAALLCWQPIRPAGAQNKMVKPHPPVLATEKKGLERRRNSDASMPKDPAIIKVGKMLLWRKGGIQAHSNSSGKGSNKSSQKGSSVPWERISCTLQENGEFRLYTSEVDTTLLTVIQLSQLNRCAVQVLDPSILDQEYCIAIYPQYTPSTSSYSLSRPVYLAIDSRMIFEVWFVLLRAFTMPELYGPAMASPGAATERIPENGAVDSYMDLSVGINSLSDSYRIQRSLFLRIVEAKISIGKNICGKDNNKGDEYELSSSIGSHHSHLTEYKEKKMDCYAEVVLDGEVRAKTMVRSKTANPFWREDYEFPDLPAVLSDVAVILKQRDPRWKKNGGGTPGGPGSVTGSGGFGGGLGGSSLPGGRDAVIGRVDIQLDELKKDGEIEGLWPLMSSAKGSEEKIGELFLKIGLDELIVLMADEYKGLSELLHDLSTGLTHELAFVMSGDLRRLANTLLRIFQVSGKSSEWLMKLAEEEIDGPYREKDFPTRLVADYSDREFDVVRQSVKIDVNDAYILFRGNSLLTKAMDAHMKRLGRDYLEETLGALLKKIVDEDLYCEIDPNKLDRQEDLGKNVRMLLSLTRSIWQAIYSSPQRCPMELRKILRHIRECCEERYGSLMQSVSFSSVSGFLFLRFFCPAVLNPKLFGLLKDHPGTRAHRTLTLITKTLQGLANMTSFGAKEPWMEPMNEFLSEHTAEFKDFINLVIDVPAKPPSPSVPPAYATPTTILARLSQSSREGFPSLPYLIDQPRAFASLVMLWDKWYPHFRRRNPKGRLEGDLKKFHSICKNIRERMKDCVEKAENAERPNSSLSSRWEEVAEKVATNSPIWGGQGAFNPTMWPIQNVNDRTGKFGSMKGYKILGVGTGGGVSFDESSNGWEPNNIHYIGRKTFSDLVGKIGKRVKGREDRNEKEREKEEKKEREREREKEKREWKEKEKEVRGEWRFVAVADGQTPEEQTYTYDERRF